MQLEPEYQDLPVDQLVPPAFDTTVIIEPNNYPEPEEDLGLTPEQNAILDKVVNALTEQLDYDPDTDTYGGEAHGSIDLDSDDDDEPARFPTHPTPDQIAALYEQKHYIVSHLSGIQLQVADFEAAVAAEHTEAEREEKLAADDLALKCQLAVLNKDNHDPDAPSNPGKNEGERTAINQQLFGDEYAALESMRSVHRKREDEHARLLHGWRAHLTEVQTDLKLVDIQIASLEMLVKWGYAG